MSDPLSVPNSGAASSAIALSVAATSSSTLTQSQQMALQTFQQSSTFTQCLDTAGKHFLDAHLDLQRAKAQLQKFQSRSANGTGSKLPNSLSLNIIGKLILPEVPGDASFYKDQLDVLRKLETDAQKTIFEQIVAARNKHIDHLAQQCNTQAFITREVSHFKQLVSTWADQYDTFNSASNQNSTIDPAAATASPNPNAFPLKVAIEQFETSLHLIAQKHAALTIEKLMDSKKKKEQQEAAQTAAQEQVLQGAHNGKTIESLATRVFQKNIKPVQQAISALEAQNQVSRPSKRKQPSSSVSTHSKTSPSSDIVPYQGGFAAYFQSFNSQTITDQDHSGRRSKRTKLADSSVQNFHRGGSPHKTRQPHPVRRSPDDDVDMNDID